MSNEITTNKNELTEIMELVRAKHKDLSDVEIKHLYHLAGTYGLDPNKNEIWAVKYGQNPAAIYVGRDGLLGIAHKTGQFAGMETNVLALDKSGNIKEVEINIGGKLVGAKCIVWRKDSERPFIVSVKFDEFNGKRNKWLSMPETMIKKVAEAHALRRAFSIHGIFVPEEMDQESVGGIETTPEFKKPERKKISELDETTKNKIQEPLMKMINDLAELTESSVETVIKEELSGKNIGDLHQDEARLVYKALTAKIKELKK